MALTDKLSAIGDAIRAVNGTTNTYTLGEMPDAILAFAESGEGDVALLTLRGDYSHAFRSTHWNDFIATNQSNIATADTTNGSYAFYETPITVAPTVNLPGGTTFSDLGYMFAETPITQIPEIIYAKTPNSKSGGITAPRMFYNCTNLTTVPNISLGGAYREQSVMGMFEGCTSLETAGNLLFGLDNDRYNCKPVDFSYLYSDCHQLQSVGYIDNMYPSDMSYMYKNCYILRKAPAWFADYVELNNAEGLFYNCHSLRSLPSKSSLESLYTTKSTLNLGHLARAGFYGCYALNSITIGVSDNYNPYLYNSFYQTFDNCNRLESLTLTGSYPGWSNQTLDLSVNVGWAPSADNILNYNSGITADKEVTNSETYAALKNDPDWFTCDVNYSRYNHDSAVQTINSLPYCSDKNTIKFKGTAGALTDGGAINTLTASEIAKATANNWTVALV